MEASIRFEGLAKTYGEFQAVHPLNFEVARGEIFGFLGPNGAGKTTTIRMIMGILVPTSGRVLVDSLDCVRDSVEVKRKLGYLPDQPIFHDYLRGRELLEFVAEMHGFSRAAARTRAAELLKWFGITDASEEFAMNYSLGMKKRLGLALAFLHDPDVLILDEPVNGLDPRGTAEIVQLLKNYAARGKTVFISTHLLDMAEKICTRVGIIDHGKIVAIDAVAKLKEGVLPGGSLEEIFLKLTSDSSSSMGT